MVNRGATENIFFIIYLLLLDFLYFPEWTPASPIELAQAGELLFQVR